MSDFLFLFFHLIMHIYKYIYGEFGYGQPARISGQDFTKTFQKFFLSE